MTVVLSPPYILTPETALQLPPSSLDGVAWGAQRLQRLLPAASFDKDIAHSLSTPFELAPSPILFHPKPIRPPSEMPYDMMFSSVLPAFLETIVEDCDEDELSAIESESESGGDSDFWSAEATPCPSPTPSSEGFTLSRPRTPEKRVSSGSSVPSSPSSARNGSTFSSPPSSAYSLFIPPCVDSPSCSPSPANSLYAPSASSAPPSPSSVHFYSQAPLPPAPTPELLRPDFRPRSMSSNPMGSPRPADMGVVRRSSHSGLTSSSRVTPPSSPSALASVPVVARSPLPTGLRRGFCPPSQREAPLAHAIMPAGQVAEAPVAAVQVQTPESFVPAPLLQPAPAPSLQLSSPPSPTTSTISRSRSGGLRRGYCPPSQRVSLLEPMGSADSNDGTESIISSGSSFSPQRPTTPPRAPLPGGLRRGYCPRSQRSNSLSESLTDSTDPAASADSLPLSTLPTSPSQSSISSRNANANALATGLRRGYCPPSQRALSMAISEMPSSYAESTHGAADSFSLSMHDNASTESLHHVARPSSPTPSSVSATSRATSSGLRRGFCPPSQRSNSDPISISDIPIPPRPTSPSPSTTSSSSRNTLATGLRKGYCPPSQRTPAKSTSSGGSTHSRTRSGSVHELPLHIPAESAALEPGLELMLELVASPPESAESLEPALEVLLELVTQSDEARARFAEEMDGRMQRRNEVLEAAMAALQMPGKSALDYCGAGFV